MNRGYFSSIAETDGYKNAEKEWIVNLQGYHKYWYDLVVNPGDVAEYFDTRKLIVEYLKGVKKEVEDHLEKRFIYFICSRERVRFDTRKKPSYGVFSKKLTLHLLLGNNERRSIKCEIPGGVGRRFFKPLISLTEKYITMTDAKGNKLTLSVHDFLDGVDVSLNIDSRVEYVGNTKNPHTRPTNGAHTGLSDVLHGLGDEHRDVLIYFNIFKVMTRAVSADSMLAFVVANAMTDEIDVDLEADILEKSFIFYFDSARQSRNKEKEFLELKNNLLKVSSENKISKIFVDYGDGNSNDYGVFSSTKVAPHKCHSFTVRCNHGSVEITKGLEGL